MHNDNVGRRLVSTFHSNASEWRIATAINGCSKHRLNIPTFPINLNMPHIHISGTMEEMLLMRFIYVLRLVEEFSFALICLILEWRAGKRSHQFRTTRNTLAAYCTKLATETNILYLLIEYYYSFRHGGQRLCRFRHLFFVLCEEMRFTDFFKLNEIHSSCVKIFHDVQNGHQKAKHKQMSKWPPRIPNVANSHSLY